MEKVRVERPLLNDKGEVTGPMLLQVDPEKYKQYQKLLEKEQKPISPERLREIQEEVFLDQ